MRYIRQRSNGNWRCKIYNGQTRFSFTSPDLDEVIERRNLELGFDPDEEKREPKVLIFDIENAPILAYVWDIWNQNIGLSQIKEDWYILCFAYKWLNEDKIHFVSLNDFEDSQVDLIFSLDSLLKEIQDKRLNNQQIAQELILLLESFRNIAEKEKKLLLILWDLFNEADIIIAHNGDAFDVKKVNSRFFYHNIPQPSPYKKRDTLKIAKQNFRFTSNKLDYLAKYKGSAGKIQHNGFPLWIDCMNGSQDAWKLMKEYNIQDVDELQSIYLDLRGWDKSHPNVTHYYSDNLTRCTNCGSDELEPTEENIPTTTQTYPGYRCKICGHFMRGRRNNTTKEKEILTTAR